MAAPPPQGGVDMGFISQMGWSGVTSYCKILQNLQAEQWGMSEYPAYHFPNGKVVLLQAMKPNQQRCK